MNSFTAPQGLDAGQGDVLPLGHRFDLFQDLFAGVHADHQGIAEAFVFHRALLSLGG